MDNNKNNILFEILKLNISKIHNIINLLQNYYKIILNENLISIKFFNKLIFELNNIYKLIDIQKKLINTYKHAYTKQIEDDKLSICINNIEKIMFIKNQIDIYKMDIINQIYKNGIGSIIILFELILPYNKLKIYYDDLLEKSNFIEKYFFIRKIDIKIKNEEFTVNSLSNNLTINIKNKVHMYIKNFNDEIYEELDIVNKQTKDITILNKLSQGLIILEIANTSYYIYGNFKDDPLNTIYTNPLFVSKYEKLQYHIHTKNSYLPQIFIEEYINQLGLNEFLTTNCDDIIKKMNHIYIEFKKYSRKKILDILTEFICGNLIQKREIIILLLLNDNSYDSDINNMMNLELVEFINTNTNTNSNSTNSNSYSISNNIININILIDIIHAKYNDSINIDLLLKTIHYNLRKKLLFKTNSNKKIEEDEEEEISYDDKLSYLQIDKKIKNKAIEKIKELKSSKENSKAELYLDGFFKIPFNKYIKEEIFETCETLTEIINNLIIKFNNISNINNISIHDSIPMLFEIKKDIINLEQLDILNIIITEKKILSNIKIDYLNNINKILDNAIYGQLDSKREIKRIIAQWMNGKIDGAILGFQGPPGVGKTCFAKNGIAKCFVDKNGNYRPFNIFQLGGASDGNVLEGHNYTYVGAKWGRLLEMLMDSKCMNPIIYFDELDKISETEKGKEIVNILIHLTDRSQNNEIFDRYFSGIPIDFSKCLFIFSYNDASKIDRILKDRITEIKIAPLKKKEKIIIVQKYSLQSLSADLNIECKLSEEIINYIIDTYTYEAGVRKLNEKLSEIFREINLRNLESVSSTNNSTKNVDINKTLIDDILTRHHKMKPQRIHNSAMIGMINGLYATTTGLGGITIIQVKKNLTNSTSIPLELTGQQGNVMKESMSCAKTLAMNLLTDDERKKILDELKSNSFGLHIHCPEASTPKDGPSAGIAITTAIYSILTNKPIRNDIALTGEVDLLGNVKAIGGLDSKINGAIKAGVRLVLFPKENQEDYEKILLADNIDGQIEICMVSTIDEVISKLIIN